MAEAAEENDPEEVYHRFRKYNFSEDPRFQEGWSKIAASIHTEANKEEELLQSKLFYFGRLHGVKLSLLGYKNWLSKVVSTKASPNENRSVFCDEDIVCDGIHTIELDNRLREHSKTSLGVEPRSDSTAVTKIGTSHTGTNHPQDDQSGLCLLTNQHVLTEEETQDRQSCCETSIKPKSNSPVIRPSNKGDNLTFEQIIELIQKGESIPGTNELNIQATNQIPTKSALKRVAKPWEK